VRALDVCAGAAGGWTLGLHRAGIETVAACEVIPWRRDLYAANFPNVRLYHDLGTLDAATLRRDRVGIIDLLAGSPPCKEYSDIGRGRGLDADDLFLQFVRLAGELRPRWVAAENSHFLKTRGYDRIADALGQVGYACWPLVVEARMLGARHGRPRAVVLAADLSREQGRPARLARPDGHLGRDPCPWARPHGSDGTGPSELLLGPAGTQPVGRHLREYDGVPAGVAEQAREAYGDAVLPQLTEAVGRAILATEAALCP
jgi:DNA (cytosine-5)-methyltransferase 1